MKIIESIDEMREYSQQCKRDGKTVASIETGGDLHEGHMSLVKIARDNADVVILSIGHAYQREGRPIENYKEILEEYKQIELISDVELCQSHGVDIIFHSFDSSWNYEVPLDIPIPIVERLMKHRNPPPIPLEVLTTWPQILDVERPDVTILGQKDIYQNFVVKSIIDKLNFPIKVIMAPTIRDSNGIAHSSRNKFLTRAERERAVSIYKTLHEVSTWSNYAIDIGSAEYIKEYITSRIQSEWCFVDICCAETLDELNTLDRDAIILVTAGPFGRKGLPLHELVNEGPEGFLTDNIFVYQ